MVGPWDWTKDERVITLENSDAFVAVEEEEGQWALYFDRDGDDLASVLGEQGKLDNAFVPVRLVRQIAEEPPPPQSQNQDSSQGQKGSGIEGQKA